MYKIVSVVIGLALALTGVFAEAGQVHQRTVNTNLPMLQNNYVCNADAVATIDLKCGLVAYYRFQELVWDGTTGEVRDISGQSGTVSENLISNSEDLTAAGWTDLGTPVNVTATSIEDDGASNEGRIFILTGVTTSRTYTYSVSVPKAGSASKYRGIVIQFDLSGTLIQAGVTINPVAGTITSRVGGSGTVAPTASGINEDPDDSSSWRVFITLQNNGTGNTRLTAMSLPAINANASATWVGATVGTNTFFKHQLEAFASASAYIKTTGTARQSSFNHGTAVNGATNIANGKLGRGGLFVSADSEYIATDNPAALIGDLDTFTIAMWVNTSSTVNTNQVLIGWGDGATNVPWLRARNVANQIILQMETGGVNERTWSYDSSGFDDGNWHLLVVTMPGSAQADISSAQAYVDGELLTVAVTDASAAQRAKAVFKIGNGGSTYLDGAIDEVPIWDRVISSDEVKHYYNGGRGRYID